VFDVKTIRNILASFVVAGEGGEGPGVNCPPLNFSLSENFLPFGKLYSKMQNLGLESPTLGEFRGEIEIFELP